MNRLSWIALLAIGLAAAPAWAGDRVGMKLDFDRYKIKDQRCAQQADVPFKCLELPDDTKNVRKRRYSFTMAPGSNYAVDVVPDPDKGKVLMLGMFPYDDGCTHMSAKCGVHKKDKIEFWAVHPNNDNRIDVRSNEARFFSFDFKLDPSYEVGSRMVLHVQARQEIPGTSPVFTMYVKPVDGKKIKPKDAPIDLVFVVRDDKDLAGFREADEFKDDDKGDDRPFFRFGRAIHTERIQRGEWNTMTLQLQPAYNGSGKEGRIVMWLNGEQQFDYRGDWGYKPTAHPKSTEIGLAFDIYRAPFQKVTQKIYFANANYATSYEDAVINGD